MFFRCSHGSVSRAFCGLPANHANKREKEFRKQESVFSVDIYSRQFACLAGSVAVAPAPSSSEGGFTLAKQRTRVSAFTLAELLVATGVTAGIVLMLGWMFGSLMSSASHANERVDAFRDARAALQMMERDLRNLVRTQWSPDPFTSPTPANTPQPLTRPAAYFAVANVWQDPNDPYSTGNPNAQIFALISASASGSPTPSGDVCAVGYYCRWDNELHAYSLRRFFNGSAATFNVLAAANYASASPSPSPALYSPAAGDPVLAAYVWNFRVTMYDSAGNIINTYPYVCEPSGTYNPSGTPPTPNPLPAAIEISFNAMSPQAARTVMSVTSDPSRWMNMDVNLVKPHAYEFHSRINLP